LLPAYFGTTLEYGNVAEERDQIFDDAILNGSVYLGYDTPIGPFYLGYGLAEGGRNRFFIRVGNVFGRGDIAR
jgi:NTE family protein